MSDSVEHHSIPPHGSRTCREEAPQPPPGKFLILVLDMRPAPGQAPIGVPLWPSILYPRWGSDFFARGKIV
jgi:hypothetical protein